MLIPLQQLRQGIRLPPSGWALAGMLAFYVLAGLVGRDPWKGEDAIHLAVAWSTLTEGHWLVLDLAGRPFTEPPLYYWSAALTGKLLGYLLPLHDAMRVASGVWTALSLTGLYYAGREMFGQDSAAATPMLLAGAFGLVIHAHDAQPMLVALAAYGGTLGALAAIWRKPRLGAAFYGLSLAVCLSGAGIAPTLPLLAIGPVALLIRHEGQTPPWRFLLLSYGIGLLAIAPWIMLLANGNPAYLADWLSAEKSQLTGGEGLSGLLGFMALLPWFSFPLLPILGWTLWIRRKKLGTPEIAVPLCLFILTLLILSLGYRPREIPSLLLLPPLALLATPGVLSLRRGAANAFDWFGMMTHTLFIIAVWFAWSAMQFGWPTKLASRVLILRPGFSARFDTLALLVALAASLWWLWLIVTAPRSPYRSLTHWCMGITTFWLSAALLLLPWFDYGKSYRPVAESLHRFLSADVDCVAERELTDTQRASLAYFVGIRPYPENSTAGRNCPWLLVTGDTRRELAAPGPGWEKIWEASRPGEKKEKFRLYRKAHSEGSRLPPRASTD